MTADGHLTLIVPAAAGVADRALPFVHRAEDVDLTRLQSGLEKVQGQITNLLGTVKEPAGTGFRLKTIEVGLTITGEGSIGVVTAGAEASLTLSFERST